MKVVPRSVNDTDRVAQSVKKERPQQWLFFKLKKKEGYAH